MTPYATPCNGLHHALRAQARLQQAEATKLVALADCRRRRPAHTVSAELTVEPGHMASNATTNDDVPDAQIAPETSAGPKILRLPQVCAMTGLGRSMIYQMSTEGRFPRRVPIGLRAVGWVEGEVQDWLQARIASRRAQPPPRA